MNIIQVFKLWKIYKGLTSKEESKMFSRIFGNWHTTLFGTLAGLFTQLSGSGLTIPTDKAGWKNFAMAAIFIIWGAIQKDAATGSVPGEVK